MHIVTLTLNPALDKSTTVDHLIPEQKLRCAQLRIDAGGGGINVSKGIRKLGGDSVAIFPVGGNNGRVLCEVLSEAGIRTNTREVAGETRENFSVTEIRSNLQYRFTLPGIALDEADADACLKLVEAQKPAYLVASGSLPPGLAVNYYERVAAFAKKTGARLILDTSGPALEAAASVGLYLLKPNLGELSALVGVEKLEMHDVDDAAHQIIDQGKCEVVVVSLGPQGALLVSRDSFEHIPAPPVKKQSTVGAGDSMVAGMVWALSQGKSLREVVQTGVACGSAATMNAGTQLFEAADAHKLKHWIEKYGAKYRFTDF